MHVVAVSRPATSHPALRAAWLLGIAAIWWLVGWSRIDQVPVASDPSIRNALPLILAGVRVAGAAFETLFYFIWWRSAGHPFSFVSALPWFATLTIVDAWAGTLRSVASDASEPWRLVLAVFAGAGVHFEPGDTAIPGLAAALGDVGLLVLGRLVGAARIQARETGLGSRGPLSLTIAVWLMVKLIAWWSYDLTRGMSPA